MQDTSSPASLTIAAAQQDMRTAYLGGAPGMFVSGTVWAIAGLVCLWHSPRDAVWALYAGGVLIHPLSVLLTRILGRSGPELDRDHDRLAPGPQRRDRLAHRIGAAGFVGLARPVEEVHAFPDGV